MVYSLQYFADTFNEGVEWKEKYDTGSCLSSTHYNYDTANERVNGWFWGYSEIVARNFTCLSLQGRAATLIPLLESNDKHRLVS